MSTEPIDLEFEIDLTSELNSEWFSETIREILEDSGVYKTINEIYNELDSAISVAAGEVHQCCCERHMINGGEER